MYVRIKMSLNENINAIAMVNSIVCGKKLGYYVMTFGCQQNEADSEKIRGLCESMGYVRAEKVDGAALIIINTCAIRHHAEEKALSYLGTLKHLKEENPSLLIGIGGCMSAEPTTVNKIKTSFRYVSFTFEPAKIHMLPTLVYQSLSTLHHREFLGIDDECPEIREDLPAVRASSHRAWVSIMYGCNNFCSYCIVPYVRGRERSRNSAEVLKECTELIRAGYKEITLLGQNVNSYKSDMDFADLLEQIASIEGDFWLRFMTSHPKDVPDKLIEVMARHRDKICPAFHLPLQSGSDRILKAMNRTYNRERYLSIVDKLRAAVPGIAITTDIIVAFPSETEEDFLDTLDIVKRVGYDKAFPFIYSPREGTRAAKMPMDIPDAAKTDRMSRLIAEINEGALRRNDEYLGMTVRVLVDSDAREGEGHYLARTDTGKLVHIYTKGESPVGKFLDVKIEKTTPFDMFGAVL